MKKIICIIIIFIITILIIGSIFFFKIFGNNKYNLKNISENQRQEIITLLNCSDISNEIDLIEMQIPKAYKDIYYEIYFETDNKNIKDYITKSDNIENIYGKDLKKLKNDNYYCVIYRRDEKGIDVLDAIADGKELATNSKIKAAE